MSLLQVKLKVKEEEPEWEQRGEESGVKDERADEALDQDDEEEEQYTVEKIIEKQKSDNGTLLYKVKWQGYSYKECTWEPLENLADHTGTCVHLEKFEKEMEDNMVLNFENEGYISKLEESAYEDLGSNSIQDVKPIKKIKKPKKHKETDGIIGAGFQSEKKIQKTRAQLESEGVQFEPEETFCCIFCGKICKSISGLHTHQKKKCNENTLKHAQCHLCNTETNSLDDLKKHMKTMHDDEKDEDEVIGRCKFCNMELGNIKMRQDNNELENKVISQRHQRLCLGKIMKTLKCIHCPVEAPSKEMLLEHLKSSHSISPPPWPCLLPDCEQVCVTQIACRSHMLIRHGIRIKDARCKRVKNITCSFCLIPNYFFSEADCKKHEEKWHKFNCSEEGCDFTCKTGLLLQDHGVKIHKKQIVVQAKPLQDKSVCCDQCGKRFNNKTHLRDHLETHEIKELMCDKCDRVFTNSVNLRAHLRRNHSTTSFDCQYCGQIFKNTRNLWNHIKQNHEEKKWNCELCGKGFVCRSKMEEHIMSVHTKTAAFICRHGCGKTYKDNPNRRAHERSVHEGKPRKSNMDDNVYDGSQGSLAVI